MIRLTQRNPVPCGSFPVSNSRVAISTTWWSRSWRGSFPTCATPPLIGYGSEILGFDTLMSTDHNWGPRVLLFLSPEDQARLDAVIIAHLDERIPETFLGWPTRIKLADANAPDADAEGRRPAALRVETHTLRSWVRGWLGVRADAELD
jgi:hypothetical protein